MKKTNPATEIEMNSSLFTPNKRYQLSTADKAKAILVRWIGDENLNLAVKGMERIYRPYMVKAYKEGMKDAREMVLGELNGGSFVMKRKYTNKLKMSPLSYDKSIDLSLNRNLEELTSSYYEYIFTMREEVVEASNDFSALEGYLMKRGILALR